MRALLLSTPVRTHFTTLVSVAWALRAAGHEVLAAGSPDVVSAAQSAGLSAVSIGRPAYLLDSVTPMLRGGLRPAHAFGRPSPDAFEISARMWALHARYLLPSYLELARRWKPDLIVCEQLEFAGPIIAAVLGIPAVTHRWSVDPTTAPMRPTVAALLAGLCERLGLSEVPEPVALLDPCPPQLQLPEAAPGMPVQFVPFNGTGSMPEWASAPARVRRVGVSLGQQTLGLHGVPLFRGIMSAFAGLSDVEAVVTVPPEQHGEFADAPPNVRVVAPTPLELFLPGCAAVVHHGGSGTLLTATRYGLPQLVLPQMANMYAVADQIAATGAGIGIDDAASQDDPTAIRKAVLALLDDPAYRDGARELRRAMLAMPTPAEVVADLEALADRRSDR